MFLSMVVAVLVFGIVGVCTSCEWLATALGFAIGISAVELLDELERRRHYKKLNSN